MNKTYVSANCEEHFREHQKELKSSGYSRTDNAYWTEIWTKADGSNQVVLTRDF